MPEASNRSSRVTKVIKLAVNIKLLSYVCYLDCFIAISVINFSMGASDGRQSSKKASS